jgi:hypothetical protein
MREEESLVVIQMGTICIEYFKSVKEGKDGRWRFCQLSAMKSKLCAFAKSWWLRELDCVIILLLPSEFPPLKKSVNFPIRLSPSQNFLLKEPSLAIQELD